MSTPKNLLLIGASGNIGTPILNALLKESAFNITILSREGSTSTFPEGVPVKKADYSSHEALVSAFRGHDTIISLIGRDFIDQLKFVDAAVEAGVKKFYPSEYGSSDPNNKAKTDEFWQRVGFVGKQPTFDKLKELSLEGKIEYTAIRTGPFFDWGLHATFLGFNIPAHTATIWNDGNQILSSSNLSFIARSLVYTLHHPAEYKNRVANVYSYKFTQNELLLILEKYSGHKFELEHISSANWIAAGEAEVKAGNPYGGFKILQGLLLDPEDKYESNFPTKDVPLEDEETIDEAVQRVLKETEAKK